MRGTIILAGSGARDRGSLVTNRREQAGWPLGVIDTSGFGDFGEVADASFEFSGKDFEAQCWRRTEISSDAAEVAGGVFVDKFDRDFLDEEEVGISLEPRTAWGRRSRGW